MMDRVTLPEQLGPYQMGDHLESGWGWDVYEAYLVDDQGDSKALACHIRVFF